MKKRVLLCEFYQESNTFNPQKSDLDDFKVVRLAEGNAYYSSLKDETSCSSCGFIKAIEEADAEVVPAISMYGCARGKVTERAFDYYVERLKSYLAKGNFDAVFCSLHGATVAENHPDACGDILSIIRANVGNEMVVSACYDLHANITDALKRACDIICGYQTYPHIDIFETGYRAGQLGMRLLNGERLYQAISSVPVLCPPSGYTTDTEPFKSVMIIGKTAFEKKQIEDYSVFNVQPWMDIPEISSTVVVIAKDPEIAKETADSMANRFFESKEELKPNLKDLDFIIDAAEKGDVPKPVILSDPSDRPNGGSVGDSVFHANRLKERKSKLKKTQHLCCV